MSLNDRFLQLALSGSEWILWVLIGLSVASAAVVLERALHYRMLARRQRELEALLEGRSEASWHEIELQTRSRNSPAARMLGRVLTAVVQRSAELGVVVETARAAEQHRLERNLGILGTVGANAPFIGLLGTVLEILRVFNMLGEQGVRSATDASSIMTGISEALVATGVGLLVAIPATIAYNAFTRRVSTLLGQAADIATVGLELPVDDGDDR